MIGDREFQVVLMVFGGLGTIFLLAQGFLIKNAFGRLTDLIQRLQDDYKALAAKVESYAVMHEALKGADHLTDKNVGALQIIVSSLVQRMDVYEQHQRNKRR